MAVCIGTGRGVFRAPGSRFDEAERVLESDRVLRIRSDGSVGGAFAATRSGLFHSRSGEEWSDLGAPLDEVYSVAADPERERILAGTHPAHIYLSENGGGSWRELLGFQDLPSRDEWHTPRHRNEAHVRSLDVPPGAPDRIVAGVEVGGVHVSDDGGETWEERRGGVSASEASGGSSRAQRSDGVHDDVHHVLVRSPEEYVASCGGGLYRTRDAGESWTRLDDDLDHTYFREAFHHDGTLYAAAARGAPPSWSGANGADAALYESTDDGDSFERVAYEGEPEEVVLAWAEVEDEVIAGTNEGRVLVREDGEWITAGRVPSSIHALAAVPES